MTGEQLPGVRLAVLERRLDQLEKIVLPAPGLITPERERFEALLALVAAEFRVPSNVLVGVLREGWMIRPRFTAQWLVREATIMPYPQIGRLFGRDHTSILHAIRRVAGWRRSDDDYRRTTDRMLVEARAAFARPNVRAFE